MTRHLIVGAGPVGSTLADLLADRGDEVVLATRSGSGPERPEIERVRADASDAGRLTELATGAATIFNCVNPPYPQWATDWPPMAAGFLAAAEATGAAYVIMGNLYPYGPVDGLMREDSPLAATGHKARIRAKVWTDALAAHDAGRLRATEVRASDFFGPRVVQSHVGERFVPKLLAGKRVQMVGDPTQPHSLSYMPDVARALAAAADNPASFGRPWHVPTLPAETPTELARDIASAGGARSARVSGMPHALLWATGVVSPMMRELRETEYQFARPYRLDSAASEAFLGFGPTPREEQVAETVAWWRRQIG